MLKIKYAILFIITEDSSFFFFFKKKKGELDIVSTKAMDFGSWKSLNIDKYIINRVINCYGISCQTITYFGLVLRTLTSLKAKRDKILPNHNLESSKN